MDFFSKLLGRQATAQRASTGPTPQQRFKHFKIIYNKLLGIWNNGQGASKDAFAAENHRLHIARIRELLAEDTRGPTPHLCISFAFTNGILRTLTQIGTTFCEPGIASEVLGILQLVVDSEEEAFLEDRLFADALPIFVEAIKTDLLGRTWGKKEETTDGVLTRGGGLEARLVEVLFGVTAAIRKRPLVLKAWFRPEQFFDDADELTEDDQPSRLEEFPLFYALIPYLTQEGRAGDFARMGILYIVESTSYSPPLERWLVEGDMAALVTSVLGALFSQLSSKLALTYNDDEMPSMLKFSSRSRKELPYDVAATSSQDYADHINSFLANLMFWQDILEHCISREVKQTLLDHFQFIFLQKLLYPSLLGSSEASSVAVLTYLRNILESVSHYDLTHRMLVYLFGLPIYNPNLEEPTTPIAKARRRKSEILLVRHTGDDDDPTPELFNLSDLITSGLKASDHDTITCTLRLLSTLLRRHHQESLPHLLKTRRARPSDLLRTYGGHQKEIDNWIALAENINPFPDLEQSYERAVHDGKNNLEFHICTYPLLKIEMPGIDNTDRWNPIEPFVLLPEDDISVSLIQLLDNFLTNDIETNLTLTQVMLDLAACGNMRLEGWLLTEPSKYVYQRANGIPQAKEQPDLPPNDDVVDTDAAIEDDTGSEAASEETNPEAKDLKQDVPEDENEDYVESPEKVMRAREEPAWPEEDGAPVYQSLDRLQAKVESFHRLLQDFDVLLAECKKEIIPEFVAANAPAPDPISSSASAIAISVPMSRDPSLLNAGTSPGAASSNFSGQSSPGQLPTTPTPARGHARSSSLANRVARVFGTSPNTPSQGMNPSNLAPTPASRLRLRLSQASSPALISRAPDAADSAGISPTSPYKRALPVRGHSRNVSLQDSLLQTPTRPSHPKLRGLRGDDLGASPSPRLDRRVVPHSGTNGDLSSSLRDAIGSESDSDSGSGVSAEDEGDTIAADGGDQSDEDGDGELAFRKTVEVDDNDITVGHLLTNIIILQEFVLEMAALISVRGTYFGEVRFT